MSLLYLLFFTEMVPFELIEDDMKGCIYMNIAFRSFVTRVSSLYSCARPPLSARTHKMASMNHLNVMYTSRSIS